jgi:hypothetical protein
MSRPRRTTVRSLCLTALAIAAAAVLTACGGDASSAAHKHTAARPGSPQNPLVAKPQEGATSEGASTTPKYGYQSLVERQTKKPQSEFTPCNLVTPKEAAAIVGPIRAPIEGPQGPTCIYRSRSGASFVTLAVQSVDFAKLRPQIQHTARTRISSRTGYCGSYGQPMLFVPLSGGRVLSISGQCAVAKRFAVKALPRVPAS